MSTFHQNKIRNFESMLTRNSLLLQVQNEITEHGITHILLRELINIKNTLKISSKEIQNVFKYPLSLLIDENTNTKVNFSIELMQMEEFCKILLDDDFISTLILQIKIIFNQLDVKDILTLLDRVEEDKLTHNNEMTKFESIITLIILYCRRFSPRELMNIKSNDFFTFYCFLNQSLSRE